MQATRVCLDARLRAAPATGVATYARAVAEALAANGRAPIFLDDATRGRFGAPTSRFDRARRAVSAMSGRPRRLMGTGEGLFARDVFRLAQVRFDRSGELLRLVAPGPPGIMHWTYPIPARIEGWANVYTVHDVVPLTHPGMTSVDPRALRARLDAIAASAEAIVTVSAASRRAIALATGIAEARIRDCGTAIVGLDPGSGALPAGLAPRGYHLFCGMDEPRKNLARIAEGWRASGAMLPLVIAGPPGAATHPGVRSVGYLPRPALVDLIAGARSLVFPTLEEGFGLPVIEAMALGTPVITADRGALAETSGGAALTVDPEDAGAIGAEILALERDDALARTLVERGRERAKAFTLDAFGARLLALYAEIAGDSGDRP